jgi:hypothetical protein
MWPEGHTHGALFELTTTIPAQNSVFETHELVLIRPFFLYAKKGNLLY